MIPDEEYDAGVAELKRYVEANGFTWQEDQTVVFNVTTAMGWMGGEIETCHETINALRARVIVLESKLFDESSTP